MSKNGPTAGALSTQDPEKLTRVQTELDHLNEIFKDVDENKRDFVQQHIRQLAWYNVSIADLQDKVDKWGTLVTYDNGGGQTGIKPNPDVKTLQDYQKLANTITRTLIPLVPEKVGGGKLAELFKELEEYDTDNEAYRIAEEEKRNRIDAECAAAQAKLDAMKAAHPARTTA